MRILLAGAHRPLSSVLLERLEPSHEILLLVPGKPPDRAAPSSDMRSLSDLELTRFGQGCQTMIHLVGPHTERVEAAAVAAGIHHIVRVEPWRMDSAPKPTRCTLRLGSLIGPGDPQGVIRAWLRWSLGSVQAKPGHAVLVDFRDAAGGIEGALWKGKPGAVYPIVGGNPSHHELRDSLRALWTGPPPTVPPDTPAPGLDAGSVDLHASRSELGWWSRDINASLRDTVASL